MLEKSCDRYLVLTTFVSGTVIMVVELLGSRVIGPPFGVSLFVWTSLITVTLVSLALGYWIGGKIADSRANPSVLYAIIFVAGIYLVSVPFIKGFILSSALSLGLRGGSLASSTVLFGPPLFLLGIVTPYVVKLYMKEGMGGLGRTVGRLYAISTCGSFLGTLLTGFVLIPTLGVNSIIYLSSLALICLTIGYFALYKRAYASVLLAAAPVIPMLAHTELPTVIRPDGTRVDLVVNEDSTYGQIKVVDYSYGDETLREFLVDNIIQGGIDVNTGVSISNYTYYIEKLAHAYNRGARTALVVGLGSGIVPRSFERHYGMETDVIEISQRVVDTANEYFAFGNTARDIYVGDGRYALESTDRLYDVIVLDAFSGDTPPSHLISVEAFSLVRDRLAPGGVVLINFVGGNRAEDRLVTSSLYGTLKEVFSNVEVFVHSSYLAEEPAVSNMIYVMYDGPARRLGTEVREEITPPVYPPIREEVEGIFTRKVEFERGPIVFTDNFNPIDFYDTGLRERFRRLTILTSDREIVFN